MEEKEIKRAFENAKAGRTLVFLYLIYIGLTSISR